MAGYRTVVVGTDGSETSYHAVERAAALAQDAHATLVIACAYQPEKPDPAAQDALKDESYQVVGSAPAEDSLRRARDHAVTAGAVDIAIDTRALQGKPADALIGLVGEVGAELLVVGNRGLNTLAGRIVGSVPQDVVRHSPVDVLVVHTT